MVDVDTALHQHETGASGYRPRATAFRVAAALFRPLTYLSLLISSVLVWLLLSMIALYQKFVSPGLRPCCRFVPSCSEYAGQALQKYGLFKGLAKTAWRLARCHPFCKGGLDQP